MRNGDILILRGDEVVRLLDGRELEIIETIERAYVTHAEGRSALPHSTFLRFPDDPLNRIIALPAYLGGDFESAGIKWVSSFPGNHGRGLDRASAVIILSSLETGRPEAIIEGSIISARRTAASAAAAAGRLHHGGDFSTLGVIGCGLINFEIVRFLSAAQPALRTLRLHDRDESQARSFGEHCRARFPGLTYELAASPEEVFRAASLVSLATTAITPHIDDLSALAPGSTLLHVSLRDLTPEAVLACESVVDDVDHVCRAQTSVHLAEQLTGGRDFIRGSLAEVIAGRLSPRRDPKAVVAFSPFGLGVLDVALAQLALRLGRHDGLGTVIGSFLPGAGIDKGGARAADRG